MRARPDAGRNRGEAGAVAVLAAILVTVLFGVAALGVDLGNAMNRNAQVQTQADTAALAGGTELPASSTSPQAGDPEVLAVASYLVKNDVYDDGSGSYKYGGMSATALASHLVSGTALDKQTYGQVYYGKLDATGTVIPNVNYLTVVGPDRRVAFGLASAMGISGVEVKARASAGIFAKGSIGALPFYAYAGCDWGQQVISHGTQNSSAPTLYSTDGWEEGSGGGAGVPTLTTPSPLVPNTSPQHVATSDVTTTLTLSGTDLKTWDGSANGTGVTAIGFFHSDGSAPTVIDKADFATAATDKITFDLAKVPTVAAANGSTFYVRVQYRVKQGTKYELRGTAISTTMPYLEVGDATLFCNDQKNSGNFGSLTVARTDSTNNANNGWLPLNIAKGTDVPSVRLNVYTNPVTTSSCGTGDTAAVHSDTVSSAINCVVTDTGFPQNPATAGFIQGVGAVPGRLTDVDSGCGGSSSGKPPTRSVQVHGQYTINNEVLTCYFLDAGTTVAEVSSKTYAGATVIDDDIYSSPRFFFVPVVNKQPSNGKKSYPIVDYRPAFMTGEQGAAVKGHTSDASHYYDDATTNGLVIDNHAVSSFRLVFINPKALPPVPGSGTLEEYTGTGPKQLLLID